MEFSTIESAYIGPILMALSAIGTVYLTFQRVKKEFNEDVEKQINAVKIGAEDDLKIEMRLMSTKIEALQKDMASMEASFQKDIDHIKSTYNNEIKNLGDKVEHLREEVRLQHTQILGLLTKMLGEK